MTSMLWGVLVVGMEGLLELLKRGVVKDSVPGSGVEDHLACPLRK